MNRFAIASLITAAGLAFTLPVASADDRDDRYDRGGYDDRRGDDDRRGNDDRRHAAAAASADPRFQRNNASLDRILVDAQRRFPGRVIDVSYDDGKYDIDIRQDYGRVVELEYSARTGSLLEVDHD